MEWSRMSHEDLGRPTDDEDERADGPTADEPIRYGGGESESNGLAQLVLAVVHLVHELLEKQAIRRMEAGSLTDEQLERIGTTLMRQADEIDRLREEFDLEPEDLELDLGGIQYLG